MKCPNCKEHALKRIVWLDKDGQKAYHCESCGKLVWRW